jgi:DNA-binding transcriptional LysR family regulator
MPGSRFTLRQIRYFVAAAEWRSIALASKHIHISEPSISASIKSLETEFGIQLFIRHHAHGLSLTQQGERLLDRARALLGQAGELELSASELAGTVSGRLEIGCLVTVYPLLVPELLCAFRARHAAARVHAVPDNHEGLMERLRHGEIELALTYDLSVPPDIDFTPLARVAPFAFVAANHALARRRSVALKELAPEPFLLLDLPLSREYFLSLFQSVGVSPRLYGSFESIEVIRGLVARGEGFGLANVQPKNQSALDGQRLSYLGLSDALPPLMYGVASMHGARPTKSVKAFMSLCTDLVSTGRIPGTQ